MTFRSGGKRFRANVKTRPGDDKPFSEPYLTRVSGDCGWGGVKQRDERGVPKNLAGLFIVEGYDKNDPANLKTLPPYSAFSPLSKLVHNAISGEHHDVKITGEDKERLLAWVDCNGPYLGDEEIRCMYDPVSSTVETIPPVRPRVASAPVINRFDIRQDGDSEKVSGPLKVYIPEENKEWLEPTCVEIISAQYGAKDKFTDVTPQLKKRFSGKRFVFSGAYNGLFGDPIRNVVKTLKVKVQFKDGSTQELEFDEDADIVLPK